MRLKTFVKLKGVVGEDYHGQSLGRRNNNIDMK
jgi:hypothetical protein